MPQLTAIQQRIYDAFDDMLFDPVGMRLAATKLLHEGVPKDEILAMLEPPKVDCDDDELNDARTMITEGAGMFTP